MSHTHSNNSYILKREPSPQCEYCQCILTVRHMLVKCDQFVQEKKDIFGTQDVEAFRFHPTLILSFLKECQFYYTFLIEATVNFILHSSLHCVL